MRRFSLHTPSPIPGFGLSFGIMMLMLSVIVLIPIGALLIAGARLGVTEFWRIIGTERVGLALALSFRAAFLAAAFNAVAGLIFAWVLVRYRFWGRPVLDAAVDLPFALPTAVAGIALTALYGPNGWLGAPLADWGIKVAYTETGIWLALVFVGLPFVVRTVQPVLEEMERELEEASATLGASRFRTIRRVILPTITPALMTGFALALARGVGEYGSVIFIAGNLPYVTEIAPLLIVIRLEEFDYEGATAIACAMLGISFAMLLVINMIQAWSRRRLGDA